MAKGYGTALILLTNTSAGSAEDPALEAAVEILRDGGCDLEVVRTREPSELDSALAGRAGRTVVLAGGDGSVHAAVTALRRRGELTDVPLGLVPMGTGNDLARTLGIPLDPAEAARALLRATPRRLDLLVDDADGVVVNVVHVGVGAEAAQRAAALKGGLGRAAYAVGGVLAGATASGWNLSVSVDGAALDLDGTALMVAVANGRTVGGGTELAPDAEPDDGLLDVVVATSTGPLARLGFGAALRIGEHVGREDVLTVRGREVSVTGEPFPLNADGEIELDVRSRTWTVEPGAWAVLA